MWSFDRRPITDAGNEAVIAEILVENSRGVFGGQVYKGARVYGYGVIGSLIICVRLRASSLDCRMAGVLSMSQLRSPSSTSSEDRWQAISSHMVSRAQLGAEGGL